MNSNIFFFVLIKQGSPLLIKRGPYLCLPYAKPAERESAQEALLKALYGIAYIVNWGRMVPIVTDRKFEFDSHEVIPTFFILEEFRFIPTNRQDTSFTFDFNQYEADVFVKFLETLRPNLFAKMFA